MRPHETLGRSNPTRAAPFLSIQGRPGGHGEWFAVKLKRPIMLDKYSNADNGRD